MFQKAGGKGRERVWAYKPDLDGMLKYRSCNNNLMSFFDKEPAFLEI